MDGILGIIIPYDTQGRVATHAKLKFYKVNKMDMAVIAIINAFL